VQTLGKGANAPAPSETLTVQVSASAAVDVSALLVTPSGKVRSDADFVFYNQPSAPGVQYRPDGVVLTLGAIPTDIDKVVVTVSLDGSGPATFGAVGSVAARVLDAGGSAALDFPVTGLSSETALVCMEVYRRNGQWKVRAVGQGYANGLAGIATDFGITVDDAPAAPASAPAAAPPPTGRPATAPPPTAQRTPSAPSGRVNLDKGRVNLQKRQTVSLVKTGAPALRTVRMGLGWDPVKRGNDVDLDASVIAFDAWGKDLDKAWYGNLSALKGAVVHSGDNLTGEGDGDDEVITIRLDELPTAVESLVFTVNSFQGQKFTELKNAYCRLLDERGTELVRYDLEDGEAKTGVIMCLMRRETDGTWSMTAIGDFHDGRNVKAMIKPAVGVLERR
jgi:stress response protein SCP2